MESENRTQYAWIALRCQSGESGAFEDLIALMERPLLYYAMTLTGKEDGALDVLQEVRLKVFRGIHKLKDPDSLRSWLHSSFLVDHRPSGSIMSSMKRESAMPYGTPSATPLPAA